MHVETIETAGAAPANPAFVVERKALAAALDFLCRVVERRNSIPILSNIKAEPSETGDALRLVGTDLDTEATLTLPAQWKVPGAFTVPAFTFRDIVKKADGADVVIEASDGKVAVSSGRARQSLPMLPVDDFPIITRPAEPARLELEARDLAAVAPAMGAEEARYYLAGACVSVESGRLAIVATNGAGLAVVERDAPGIPDIESAIIPRKAVALIGLRLKKTPGAVLSIAIGSQRAVIAGDGWELATKLVDGSFPSWRAAELAALGEGERQSVALVEAEPRIDGKAVAAFEKAVGPVSVEMGEKAVALACPAFPEWRGLIMLKAADEAERGFGFNAYHGANEAALSYLQSLAEARGLPKLEVAGLHRDAAGLIVGMSFGKGEWIDGGTREVVDYETLTTRIEHVPGHREWEPGSYSVAMPRSHQSLVAVEILGADGEVMESRPVRTNEVGAIELSAAAVAALCGPVEGMSRVEIEPMQFHYGKPVTGYFFPPAPRVGKRKMTDREQLEAYCRDPEGFTASLRPRPLEPTAVAPAVDPVPAPLARPVLSAPEPVSAPPAAGSGHPEPVSPPHGPENGPSDEIPASWEGSKWRARAWAELGTGAAVDHAAPPAVEMAGKAPRTPARERLIRRYLAIREERALLRASLERSADQAVEMFGRAEKAEREAAGMAESVHQFAAMLHAEKGRRRRAVESIVRMRRQRELDRVSLNAARAHLREIEAERDKIVHLDQGPGYGAIAALHRERAAAGERVAAAEQRAAGLERRLAFMGDEMERLGGRVARAEAAARLASVPRIPVSYANCNAARVRVGGAA